MVKIRNFNPVDAERCEQILNLNNQLHYPEIDGKEAMKRIYKRQGRYFLVAEENRSVVGFVRGVYDGSRALTWQLSVHPEHQKKGIGKRLIKKLAKRFKEDGAPTISVSVNDKTKDYYKKFGFEEIGVELILAKIDDVTDS